MGGMNDGLGQSLCGRGVGLWAPARAGVGLPCP